MKIGWIGLGKVGFPCALVGAAAGHEVHGYDPAAELIETYRAGYLPYIEPSASSLWARPEVCKRMHFCDSIREVVHRSDLVFVAVQTPHPPELDGSVRFHHARKDFDYSFLSAACRDIACAIDLSGSYKCIIIVSTVLPGTTRNLLLPAMEVLTGKRLGSEWGLVYNPSFIAQGTTVQDYREPEFALVGQNMEAGDSPVAGQLVEDFYRTIHTAPVLRMTWDSAELAKVGYNTALTVKLTIANTIAMFCDALPGADCDEVMNAVKHATRRVCSPMYFTSGMGDGGSCHPRDNIALAYHSDKLSLPYNLYDHLMGDREQHTEWLADIIEEERGDLPILILGRAFKPGINLDYGSPTLLLANILKERRIPVGWYDHMMHLDDSRDAPMLYFLGLNDEVYAKFPFAPSGVIVDPWGLLSAAPAGCRVVRPGRKPRELVG
jgi:UDPglucose 6-dehydrogenase